MGILTVSIWIFLRKRMPVVLGKFNHKVHDKVGERSSRGWKML